MKNSIYVFWNAHLCEIFKNIQNHDKLRVSVKIRKKDTFGSHLQKLKNLEEWVTLLRNIQRRQSERENAERSTDWEENRKGWLRR